MKLSIVVLLCACGAAFGNRSTHITAESDCSKEEWGEWLWGSTDTATPSGNATSSGNATPSGSGFMEDKQAKTLQMAEALFKSTRMAAGYAVQYPAVAIPMCTMALRVLRTLISGINITAHKFDNPNTTLGYYTTDICHAVEEMADQEYELVSEIMSNETEEMELFQSLAKMNLSEAKEIIKQKLEAAKEAAASRLEETLHSQYNKHADFIGILVKVSDMASSMGLTDWVLENLSIEQNSVFGKAWGYVGGLARKWSAESASSEDKQNSKEVRKEMKKVRRDIRKEMKKTMPPPSTLKLTPLMTGKAKVKKAVRALTALRMFVKAGKARHLRIQATEKAARESKGGSPASEQAEKAPAGESKGESSKRKQRRKQRRKRRRKQVRKQQEKAKENAAAREITSK